ncbi:YuiB family protein [Barrientosiimonas marina]|uniref:YuiB family protein n=1 Tax=Lentibacillus kimchii TaxID=1542911 RepID=A0ABW2UTW2_9BACI
MIQFVVSILLFLVIFFGLAFILNMLLRTTWLMAIIYPIIIVMIVDGMPTTDYFTAPQESFTTAFTRLTEVTAADITILGAGFAGTIISGIIIKLLRKNGYQMF